MNKGFPRPRMTVKEPRRTYDVAGNEGGIKGKEFPVPYTAKDNLTKAGKPKKAAPFDLANLSNERTIECLVKKVCVVCGDRVIGRKVWVYLHFGNFVSDSGPFHEKCVRLTENLCPAIKHQQAWQRVGQRRERFEFKQVYWSDIKSKIAHAQKINGFTES